MSEKMIPSGKKYEGPKYALKESLADLTQRIENLTQADVVKGLEKFKNIIPGKSADINTFEMMALYQKAMNYMDYDVTVDGRFGRETFKALTDTQRTNLKFTGDDIDGLPGPKTTEALIKALQKPASAPVQAPPVAPAPAKPASAPVQAPPVAPAPAKPASAPVQAPPVAPAPAKPASAPVQAPPVAPAPK